MFVKYKIKDHDYECHGCGSGIDLIGIILPNLCNQSLVLCSYCYWKLFVTLKDKKSVVNDNV